MSILRIALRKSQEWCMDSRKNGSVSNIERRGIRDEENVINIERKII
ncbi:MAG: hypothetical protein RML40_05905 [Bacteroidota bacterium]|nr:hypothetical protein [Bacteroidota bacterium]